MPDVPPEAVTAAVDATLRQPGLDGEDLRPWVKWISTIALEAAAPAMAEAVAQKITAHMEAHGPQAGTLRRAWRRYFRIAAQVATLAFSTEEDIKRQAAEALARGDFAACYLDDTGNPVAAKREDEDLWAGHQQDPGSSTR